MSWEPSNGRSSFLQNKYILGYIPFIHLLVILCEMAFAARLTARFNASYEERPILTMMVTNAILGGIADTVAQTITAVRHRSGPRASSASKKEDFDIEITDLNEKTSYYDTGATSLVRVPPPFDFERLTRFMGYGFCIAPLQFRWFKFLEYAFPMSKTSSFGPALKRVAMDQFVFAPFGIALFFTAMTIAEGGGRRAVTNKLRDMYIPTLKANFVVWPAVQVINFRLMPVQFQLPFVSTIGIAWTAYLSLNNSSD